MVRPAGSKIWWAAAGSPGSSLALCHGGLRDTQASALLASRELASRLARQKIPKRRPLDRAEVEPREILKLENAREKVWIAADLYRTLTSSPHGFG